MNYKINNKNQVTENSKTDYENFADLHKYIGLNYVEMSQYKKSNEYLTKSIEMYTKLDSSHPSIKRVKEFIEVNNQYLNI